MIELPGHIVPNGAGCALVDRGGVLRGATALRVNRLGSHYRAAITLPPLDGDDGRIVVARLIRAKREGLRVAYPLLSVDQSVGAAVVVDGAGQIGSRLAVRGLTANAWIREGFWLSIQSAAGQHYLHNVGADVRADGSGRAVLALADTLLRYPFADGARVHIEQPMIEGIVEGDDFEWTLSVAHHTAIDFTIEEAA